MRMRTFSLPEKKVNQKKKKKKEKKKRKKSTMHARDVKCAYVAGPGTYEAIKVETVAFVSTHCSLYCTLCASTP